MNNVEMVSCPTQIQLCHYLNDELENHEVDQIEEHVENCKCCEARIKRHLDRSAFLETQSGDKDLSSPPELQHYRCLENEVLGCGGFGVVWKMKDIRLNRDVAVKVMKFRDSKKISLVRRFLSEAQICSQLTHPFIIPIYDMGQLSDGRGYYVMKLVEGVGLNEYFEKPVGQWMPKIQIFGNICQAIAHAHTKNVIHRDLKPQNIMVGSYGEIQVMDWGLAKVFREKSASINDQFGPPCQSVMERARQAMDKTAEAAIGTDPYTPPEQARNATTTDSRSDVFSLGAILCQLLTGSPPYRGTTQREVQRMAINAELAEANSRLSQSSADPRIASIAKSCISADPNQRPENARELSDSIQGFINDLEEELQQERIQNERQTQRALEEYKRRKIKRAFLSIAVILTLVTLLSVLYLLQNR